MKPKSRKQAVDFTKLDVQALKRYQQIHGLKIRQNSTRTELLTAITHHFNQARVNEAEVIEDFLESLKQFKEANGIAPTRPLPRIKQL